MTDPASSEELIRLASADNFRDVAGPGYRTRDGGRVRRGVLYRSNELRLTPEDAASLAALGITTVCDLRTAAEVERHPDLAVPGATWRHFDLLGIPAQEVPTLPDPATALAMMEEVYRRFVADPGTRAVLGALLTELATDGVHLFHCTAGKDRTGWVAALVLHVAGVDDETVLADYLRTNETSAASQEAARILVVERLGPEHAAAYEPVLRADARFLHTAYDEVAAAYGTRERYLREGLGLSPATLATLRAKLRG